SGSADTLDGSGGVDSMTGGAGDDVYLVDNSADALFENDGEGVDTVRARATAYTLGANIEVLTYSGLFGSATGVELNFTGVGNGIGNAISGGGSNDTLDGMAGADTLTGGPGNDTYIVDDAADQLVEAAIGTAGADTVKTTLNAYTLGGNLELLTFIG